jgi:hypothetical protein
VRVNIPWAGLVGSRVCAAWLAQAERRERVIAIDMAALKNFPGNIHNLLM